MQAETENTSSKRLLSLDVFRGMTVAGMVLVNNPGTWSAIYPPLKHADWHGWTPTDMIFPFFVFIVGIAIPIALGKRIKEGGIDGKVYWKIFKRAALIFLLGLIQMGFPFFDISKTDVPFVIKAIAIAALIAIAVLFFADKFKEAKYTTIGLIIFLAGFYLLNQGFPSENFQKIRIMGVLQRIAICYLFASLIFLWTNWKQQIYIALILLLGYWAAMLYGGNGDLSMEGNFSGFIDRLVIPKNHLYKPTSDFYDPEGLFSTLPAIATCLIGVLAGTWIKTRRDNLDKVSGMFAAGVVLTAIGWMWNFWFPINKPIWTSSYVMFMGGTGLCFLALCYWLIDIKNYKGWIKPFVIFGTNALALYFASAIFARVLANIKWQSLDGKTTNGQKWFFDTFFLPYAEPINASLAFAIFYILFWLFLMWLLYRKKIFIKV